MRVERVEQGGKTVRYDVSEGGFRASGTSLPYVRWQLRERQRRAGEPGFVDAIAWPFVLASAQACLNLVARPLPTALLGAIAWTMHRVAAAVLPGDWCWQWGAHVFFALVGVTAMSRGVAEVERAEGLAINGLEPGQRAAWQAAYWGAMVASVAASAWLAGLGFDWLVAHGWIKADTVWQGRDGVRFAAGTVALVWRRDFHPTLVHPPVPLMPWLRM